MKKELEATKRKFSYKIDSLTKKIETMAMPKADHSKSSRIEVIRGTQEELLQELDQLDERLVLCEAQASGQMSRIDVPKPDPDMYHDRSKPHAKQSARRASILTEGDIGISTGNQWPPVSDKHIRFMDKILKNLKIEPKVREVLAHVDIYNFFEKVSEKNAISQFQLVNKLCTMVRAGDKVLTSGPNLFVAVCVAIILGPRGSLYCCRFGEELLNMTGFGHFLNQKRMVWIPVHAMKITQEGFKQAAPYDVILTPSSDYYRSHLKSQLSAQGFAFNYRDLIMLH
jgi:hypothetical protein